MTQPESALSDHSIPVVTAVNPLNEIDCPTDAFDTIHDFLKSESFRREDVQDQYGASQVIVSADSIILDARYSDESDSSMVVVGRLIRLTSDGDPRFVPVDRIHRSVLENEAMIKNYLANVVQSTECYSPFDPVLDEQFGWIRSVFTYRGNVFVVRDPGENHDVEPTRFVTWKPGGIQSTHEIVVGSFDSPTPPSHHTLESTNHGCLKNPGRRLVEQWPERSRTDERVLLFHRDDIEGIVQQSSRVEPIYLLKRSTPHLETLDESGALKEASSDEASVEDVQKADDHVAYPDGYDPENSVQGRRRARALFDGEEEFLVSLPEQWFHAFLETDQDRFGLYVDEDGRQFHPVRLGESTDSTDPAEEKNDNDRFKVMNVTLHLKAPWTTDPESMVDHLQSFFDRQSTIMNQFEPEKTEETTPENDSRPPGREGTDEHPIEGHSVQDVQVEENPGESHHDCRVVLKTQGVSPSAVRDRYDQIYDVLCRTYHPDRDQPFSVKPVTDDQRISIEIID